MATDGPRCPKPRHVSRGRDGGTVPPWGEGQGLTERLRVLHVEDDDLDAELLSIALAEADSGARLQRAESLSDALEVVRPAAFDVYIVDWHLPDGSGIDLIAQARAGGVTAPMILMTGLSDAAAADDGLAAGASDFLPKNDLSPERLRRCLRYTLEAHRLAQRLREHARALQADSLLVLGEDGRVLFATAAAEELFDRPLGELQGGDLGVEIDGDEGLIEVLRPDGGVVQVAVRAALSTWEAKPAKLVWLRDTTADISRDEALASSQGDAESVVSRLAAGIAHDFNNLIGGVIGHLELAGLPDLDPRRSQRHLREALGTAERAAELTSQLLAFARRAEPALVPLDLSDWLAGLAPAARKLFAGKARLEVRSPTAPLWVLADLSGLEQALLNLAGNARDAGGDLVVLELADADGTARIQVKDRGCGMPDDVLAMAFDPFFTTKPVGEGTGLGLPIARRAIQQMGGTFEIETEVGVGTTVEITLPLMAEQPRPDSGDLERLPDAGPRGGTGRVLVVDDEAPIRTVVQAALAASGYEVIVARGASEALTAFETEGPFDLILTDLTMPEMDGLELIETVRRKHPGQRAAIMSGYGARALSARGQGCPGDPILPKPFRIAAVVEFVHGLLGGPE